MNKLHFISNYNKMLKDEMSKIEKVLTKGNLTGCMALWNKIEHMIKYIGQPESVEPMIKAILKGQKWIKFPPDTYHNNSTDEIRKEKPNELYKRNSKGHFRWDHKVYVLTEDELKIVGNLLKNW